MVVVVFEVGICTLAPCMQIITLRVKGSHKIKECVREGGGAHSQHGKSLFRTKRQSLFILVKLSGFHRGRK